VHCDARWHNGEIWHTYWLASSSSSADVALGVSGCPPGAIGPELAA
jgi:hypothetical protein